MRGSNFIIKIYEDFFFIEFNVIVVFYVESLVFNIIFLDTFRLYFLKKICRIRNLDKMFLMCFLLIKFCDLIGSVEKR